MTLQHVLLLNLVLAAMLTGLIWLVQLVHYPGFKLVGANTCRQYQRHHTRRISWIVIPLMLAELVLACWLLFNSFTFQVLSYLNYAAFACLALVWLVTFALAMPLHRRLSQEGYTDAVIEKLVKTNWVRTIGWTLRLILLFAMALFYV